ncbi:hypothetical protein [Butyrivibrio sp. WCD2001]|uniref:hypothetical protein n=1 Tax=Butyrivibrio sp. WCD2001 TaxID=1280681 RepID=UPI00042A5BE4|nr:hypothetical protein [Butyrivibrio sp. WCD2001]
MNFEDFKENFSSDVKDTLERRNGIEYEVDARTVEKMNSTYRRTGSFSDRMIRNEWKGK